MRNTIWLIVAAGLVLGTAANAVPAEFCRVVANDSAYIMGARQQGQPMKAVGAAINWKKYEQAGLNDLLAMIMATAWGVPVQQSSQERQAAVSEFARANFDACRNAK